MNGTAWAIGLVIVIDDVLAQSAFGARGAVGKQLWIPDMGPGLSSCRGSGPCPLLGACRRRSGPIRAQFYYPFAQVPDSFLRRWSQLMSIAVRTSVPPFSLVQSLRRELRGAANDQVLYEVRTLEQLAPTRCPGSAS